MNIKNYYSELMKQDFSDSYGTNYTKLVIMLFLEKESFVLTDIKLYDLVRFIYRFYIDNPDFALVNSNVILRNISKYRVVDLVEYVQIQLTEWVKSGNGILQFRDQQIFTTEKLINESELINLKRIVMAIKSKQFGKLFMYSDNIYNELVQINKKKDSSEYEVLINNSRFRNRALEDFNYCFCCDEMNKSRLMVSHIDKTTYENFFNIENSIVLCIDHFKLYKQGYFRFLKNGKIDIIKPHAILDKRMHLNINLSKRREPFL